MHVHDMSACCVCCMEAGVCLCIHASACAYMTVLYICLYFAVMMHAYAAAGVPGTPPQHTHRKGSRRMKSILNRIRGKHKQDRDGSSVGPSGAQVLREDQGVDMSDGEAPAGPHTIDLPAEGDSMDSADDTVSGMESQASALTEPNQSSGTMSDTRPSRHSRHSSSERETPLARVSTRSQVANGAPAAEPLQAEFLPPSSPFSQEAIPEQVGLTCFMIQCPYVYWRSSAVNPPRSLVEKMFAHRPVAGVGPMQVPCYSLARPSSNVGHPSCSPTFCRLPCRPLEPLARSRQS